MSDTNAPLEDRIRAILVERLFLETEPAAIGESESLTDAYGVDSVRLFDMVVGLEEDFDISFEDEELSVERFDSVAEIALRIREKTGAA